MRYIRVLPSSIVDGLETDVGGSGELSRRLQQSEEKVGEGKEWN